MLPIIIDAFGGVFGLMLDKFVLYFAFLVLSPWKNSSEMGQQLRVFVTDGMKLRIGTETETHMESVMRTARKKNERRRD